MVKILKLIERKEEKEKQVNFQRKKNDQKKLIIDRSIQISVQLNLSEEKWYERLPFYAIDLSASTQQHTQF